MHLLQLAQQRMINGKNGFAAAIAGMCLDSGARLTAEELRITYEILELLIDKIEVRVRRNIADILCKRADVTRELIDFLCRDTIGVASPMILHSSQLSDEDLIDIAKLSGVDHGVAVASRDNVSETVTRVLVDLAVAEIETALLRNASANIGPDSMEKLVERSQTVESHQELLVRRKDLPKNLAIRLHGWVGDALRDYIADHFDVDQDVVGDAVDQAVQDSIQAVGGPAPSPGGGQQARRLYDILSRDGEGAFLEAYADMTDVSVAKARTYLSHESLDTLAIACKAVGFSADLYTDTLSLLLGPARMRQYEELGVIEANLNHFHDTDPTEALATIAQWRQ